MRAFLEVQWNDRLPPHIQSGVCVDILGSQRIIEISQQGSPTLSRNAMHALARISAGFLGRAVAKESCIRASAWDTQGSQRMTTWIYTALF